MDLKTARARPTSIEPMYRFQAATYCQLAPGASGEARIDTLVKTRIPQIIFQSFEFTAEDLRAIQNLYPCSPGRHADEGVHAQQAGADLLAAELRVLAELRI